MHSSRPTHFSSDLYFGGGRDIELLKTKSVLQLYMKVAPTYKRIRDDSIHECRYSDIGGFNSFMTIQPEQLRQQRDCIMDEATIIHRVYFRF